MPSDQDRYDSSKKESLGLLVHTLLKSPSETIVEDSSSLYESSHDIKYKQILKKHPSEFQQVIYP